MPKETPLMLQPQLSDVYPMGGVYLASDFYSRKHENFYQGIYIVFSETTDEKNKDGANRFRLCLRFTEECPMWQSFAGIMPEVEISVLFEGYIYAKKNPASFDVTGEYLHEVSLPFLSGNMKTTRCRLRLVSHEEDYYDIHGAAVKQEPSYMSQAFFSGAFEVLGKGYETIWLTENIYQHGQKFVVAAEFEEGFSIGNALNLIGLLSGQPHGMELPDWIPLDCVKLTDIAFSMRKEVSAAALFTKVQRESYEGVAVCLELTLPVLPIPFFSDSKEPAVVSLLLEWDLLSLSAVPSIIIAFKSSWNGYSVNLNMDILEQSFCGRLYSREEEVSKEEHASMIFPGFTGLVLSDLRVVGDIPEVYYGVEIAFSNPKTQKLPLSGRFLDIDWISGWGFYTSEGMGLGINLRIILLEAMFEISGSYVSSETGKLLTLQGDLKSPILLLSLISYLLGTEIEGSAFALNIEELHLRYVTDFSQNDRNLSEENVQSFAFSVGILFTWEAIALKVKTTFYIDWSKDREGGYFMSLSAQVEFLGFIAKAICDVNEKEKELTISNMRFELRMAGLDLVASVEKKEEHDILTFTIHTINLGVMLEALVDMIIPGTNWYLPWPFGVLKQLTLQNIVITIDNTTGYVKVEYKIDLRILILHLKSIVLEYGDGRGEYEEHFTLTLDLGIVQTKESGVFLEQEDYKMDFLKGNYPSIPGLGDSKFKLRYLAVGQRVKIEIPKSFDEVGISGVLEQLKKQIKKDGVPVLDIENNWVFALQLKLMDSIDVTVLLCDPSMYGLELSIGCGCDMTKALAGLKLIILYSKVTENIGMFYARLSLPEAFKRIELGAVSIQLGEVSIAIYTNGDFKVDFGFPHGGDFSRSFGLTYLIFGGKGGIYLGVLHGATSTRVPVAKRGHFDTVLELGVGISAGLSREISFGPLRFGAAIQMVGIFEGVIAQYVPENINGQDATYFYVSAMAGVTAYIYGEVDFVILKISFSVSLSITANLTIESYRKTLLSLQVAIMVRAFIKILFIKINFSFQFKWNPSFTLGEDSVAPWENNRISKKTFTEEYHLNWENLSVFSNPKEIKAMLTPFGSMEGVRLNGVEGKKVCHRMAMLPILHGYQNGTARSLHYKSAVETPFPILVEGTLKRCCLALSLGEVISIDALEWLLQELSKEEMLHTGFSMEALEEFFQNNIHICFLPWEKKDAAEEHGIPFPIPPIVTVLFAEEGKEVREYDLSKEPMITDVMLKEMESYYAMLRPVGTGKRKTGSEKNKDAYSMTEYLFCDYFHMLAKVVIGQALQQYGQEEKELTIHELTVRVMKEEVLSSISGLMSKSVMGGMRFPYERQDGYETESVFTFANQQYDVEEEKIYHYSLIRDTQKPWFYFDSQGEQKNGKIDIQINPEDVTFPSKDMQVEMNVGFLSYYEKQQKCLELINPTEVLTQPLCKVYDIREGLPKVYQVVTYDEGNERVLAVKKQPCEKIYLPLTKSANNCYSLGCLSKDTTEKLYGLSDDDVTDIEIYRTANGPGEPGMGLLPIEGELFLYRQNLSLEAEKPLLLGLEGEPKNSARLSTQKESFIKLLRDATLVNARGYYLTVTIPEEALQEGYILLTLLLGVKKQGTSLKLDYEKQEDMKYRPVVKSRETYEEEIYRPGHIGIYLDPNRSEDFLSQPFQMLCTRIESGVVRPNRGGGQFQRSNESLPVTSLIQEESSRFAQVLPLYRCFTEEEDPYAGIFNYQSIRLVFSLLDVVGNQTSPGVYLDVPMGYTDTLESPAVYPYTKLSYGIKEENGRLEFEAALMYKPGEDKIKKEEEELIQRAYFQLLQPDTKLELSNSLGSVSLEKAPLLSYLKELGAGGQPSEAIIYSLEVPRPQEALTPMALYLIVRRDITLVSELITSEEIKGNITVAKAVLSPREEEIMNSHIAKQSSTGELYYLNLPDWEMQESSADFAIPPFSEKLISMKNLPVHTLSGEMATVSYSDIDLEIWQDIFFRDFEQVIGAASPLNFEQEELEKMLSLKEGFSDVVSKSLSVITQKQEERNVIEAAEGYLKEKLKQDLYLARNISAISVFKSSGKLPEGYAYTGTVKKGQSGFLLSPGKMKQDGIFAAGITCDEIKEQWKVEGELDFLITDVEVAGEGIPCYYSYLCPEKKKITLNTPVPNRYFPSLPKLTQHRYLPSPEILLFDYQFCFSHDSAAQDTIHIYVETENRKRTRNNDSLPQALAQYMFLREEILSAKEGAKSAMIDTSEKILASLKGKSRKTFLEGGLKYAFTVEKKKGELLLQEGDGIFIELLSKTGEWMILEGEQARYRIPLDSVKEPYEYRFTLPELPLASVHQVNTRFWVTRNQFIPQISPEFVLQTEEVCYPSFIHPRVVYQNQQNMGKFERTNFSNRITNYARGFGDVSIQISCGRALGNEKSSYLWLPILLLPRIGQGKLSEKLEAAFLETNKWMEKNLREHVRKEAALGVYLTLYDVKDENYNKAEMEKLIFEVF